MEASINLTNESLSVEVVLPGKGYVGSRFDWTGWVKQVTWYGEISLCTEESLRPGYGTGGFGLCGEFGIEEPIGYEDCAPGEQFPKLGVGLLRKKNDGEYKFFDPFDIEPFPVTIVRQSDDSVTILSEPLPCRGYEARLKRTIKLDGDSLILASELTNVGTRTIKTTEYNHNFMRVGDYGIGPDYTLLAPFVSDDFNSIRDYLVSRPGEIHWLSRPIEGEAFYGKSLNFDEAAANHPTWTLLHKPSGYGVSETLDRPLLRFAVWGESHVVSPELFHEISLEPGETSQWSRTYRFFRRQG